MLLSYLIRFILKSVVGLVAFIHPDLAAEQQLHQPFFLGAQALQFRVQQFDFFVSG